MNVGNEPASRLSRLSISERYVVTLWTCHGLVFASFSPPSLWALATSLPHPAGTCPPSPQTMHFHPKSLTRRHIWYDVLAVKPASKRFAVAPPSYCYYMHIHACMHKLAPPLSATTRGDGQWRFSMALGSGRPGCCLVARDGRVAPRMISAGGSSCLCIASVAWRWEALAGTHRCGRQRKSEGQRSTLLLEAFINNLDHVIEAIRLLSSRIKRVSVVVVMVSLRSQP